MILQRKYQSLNKCRTITGVGAGRETKESLETAYRYLKANSENISGSISTTSKDYLMHLDDINGIGMTKFWIIILNTTFYIT
jgi:predicted ATP-dependent Lon-type protease